MKKEELHEFNFEDIEDEDLKCSICHYYFTKNLQPYSLNCNHNLCLKCMDALIEKNMFNCPICRRSFSIEDRNNFQINKKYLDFVTKILEIKFIFCNKCQKVYNFIEHFESCDQINFKDSHESFGDINNLAKDCLKIIKFSNKHLYVLNTSESSIYEEMHRIMKIININFYELFNKTIEKFIEGIAKINQEEFIEEVFNYLKSYENFIKACINENHDSKNKDQFSFWIENHINKLPIVSRKNGEVISANEIPITEIMQCNFIKYMNFKEIKNSPHLNFNKNKYVDSDNDREYDLVNFNSNKNKIEDSKDIANRYKKDNFNQIEILFSKNKNITIKNSQNIVVKNNQVNKICKNFNLKYLFQV
jgi:hypothetical protein